MSGYRAPFARELQILLLHAGSMHGHPARRSGVVISRAGIRGRDIVLTVLVFMFEREVGILEDANGFK